MERWPIFCKTNQSETPPMSYSIIAKSFHWGVAALFAYGIIKQVDNVRQLEDSALLRFEIYFAALFLVILVIRYVYVTRTQRSALPPETGRWQRTAARLVHLGMYAGLASIAVTGLLIALLFWLGLRDGVLMQAATELHGVAVTLSYWLIGMHVLAAVCHRVRGDGVWSAMAPVLREPPTGVRNDEAR